MLLSLSNLKSRSVLMLSSDESKKIFYPEDDFSFDCRKDLSCFTSCCQDINIFLTPLDVLRMKNALSISSTEFLEKYTKKVFSEHSGLPMVQLKMNEENNKRCYFVTEEGCTIYPERPWACRMYPIDRVDEGDAFYFMTTPEKCKGLKEKRSWNLWDWLHGQGLKEYLPFENQLKEMVETEAFTGKKIENPKITEMYYMALYDIDRFREFIFQTKFLEYFYVDEEETESWKKNDLELLKFAFKWVKFGLVGGRIPLKINPEVAKEKIQKEEDAKKE